MLNKLSSADTIDTQAADEQFGLQTAHGFDLQEAISFVWRQWKFIASIVAIALLIGVSRRFKANTSLHGNSIGST